MIPFLFQTLVELVYLFLPERGFISANATSRNGKCTDLFQYSLTVSEGIILEFICCPHDRDHLFAISNLLAKLAALAHTD